MSIYENNKYIYIVNSNHRLPGSHSSSDFMFRFNFPADFSPDHVGVMQLSCPKSYYLFDIGCTFTVCENNGNRPITLPPGNYTKGQLISTLQSLLNYNTNQRTYTITFDIFTAKFTFTVVCIPQPITYTSFVFGTTVCEQLGFEPNSTYIFSTDYSLLQAPNILNLQSETTLILLSDMCLDSPNGMLQELFTNTYDLGLITFTSPDVDLNSKRMSRCQTNTYRFTLVNEDLKVMNLNGLGFVFSLIFFQKNQTDTLTANNILLKNMDKLSASHQQMTV